MPRSPIKGSDIPEEQAIFTGAWNFLKEFYNLKQDDSSELWSCCTKLYSDLARMGSTDDIRKLASDMARTVLAYIERRSRF